jgi:hypothetical protein
MSRCVPLLRKTPFILDPRPLTEASGPPFSSRPPEASAPKTSADLASIRALCAGWAASCPGRRPCGTFWSDSTTSVWKICVRRGPFRRASLRRRSGLSADVGRMGRSRPDSGRRVPGWERPGTAGPMRRPQRRSATDPDSRLDAPPSIERDPAPPRRPDAPSGRVERPAPRISRCFRPCRSSLRASRPCPPGQSPRPKVLAGLSRRFG